MWTNLLDVFLVSNLDSLCVNKSVGHVFFSVNKCTVLMTLGWARFPFCFRCAGLQSLWTLWAEQHWTFLRMWTTLGARFPFRGFLWASIWGIRTMRGQQCCTCCKHLVQIFPFFVEKCIMWTLPRSCEQTGVAMYEQFSVNEGHGRLWCSGQQQLRLIPQWKTSHKIDGDTWYYIQLWCCLQEQPLTAGMSMYVTFDDYSLGHNVHTIPSFYNFLH